MPKIKSRPDPTTHPRLVEVRLTVSQQAVLAELASILEDASKCKSREVRRFVVNKIFPRIYSLVSGRKPTSIKLADARHIRAWMERAERGM